MSRLGPDTTEKFARIIMEGVAIQQRLPWLQMVADGGTMAAIHAGHRFSGGTDHATMLLRDHFAVAEEQLEDWSGWQTNRVDRPVIILGERHGVELGVRQSCRTIQCEVAQIHGLWVPTAPEALRIKAYQAAKRGATQDYVDVAALANLLGPDVSLEAASYLNLLYEPVGKQTALTKLAAAARQLPHDLAAVDLARYKGIRPPYDHWPSVAATVRHLGEAVLEREMEGTLPSTLSALERSPFWQPTVMGSPPPVTSPQAGDGARASGAPHSDEKPDPSPSVRATEAQPPRRRRQDLRL